MADAESPEGRLAAARRVQSDVDEIAAVARQQYQGALRTAARRWARAKFLLEQSFTHLGLLLYAVVALAGIFYAAAYYDRFGIAILDLYETPDFLLSATSSVTAVVVAMIGVGAVLWFLLWTYGAYVKADAYREKQYTRTARRFRGEVWLLGAFSLIVPLLLAGVVGCGRAKLAVKYVEPQDFVRVALRGTPSSAIALPNPGRTILVGTTNRFHVFYQCAASDRDPGADCGDGNAFVVATENVAAIAYDHATEAKPNISDVAAAIRSLGQGLSAMGGNTTIDVGSVNAEVDGKDLAGAITGLADAVDPLTIKTEIDPSDLTVKAMVEPVEVNVKADVGIPDLTIRAEIPEGVIPRHSHQNTSMVILGGSQGVAPVYVVPFDAPSPLTTSSRGLSINREMRRWLGGFYASLSECNDVRLRVTGYASRKGFGDPEHRSLWKKVLRDDEATARMNCGLANLRALAAVSALFGSTGPELPALREATTALDKRCPNGEAGCLFRKAVDVRNKIFDMCPASARLEWQPKDDDRSGPAVGVNAWSKPSDGWRGVGEGRSRMLSRTVHVSVDGDSDQGVCPQLWNLGVPVVGVPPGNITVSTPNG